MAAPVPVTEFFAPFAHVPGRFEWCRIRSPTHGVFDCFIVLGASTAVPATVYVRDDVGEAFMHDRYPECTALRVPGDALSVTESDDGRTVTGHLEAETGPVRRAEMTLRGAEGVPEEVPYGGTGFPVWGGRWTCEGVDLNVPARVSGFVEDGDGAREDLSGAEGIVTLGSHAVITPLA